jgi:hypothetical protein
MTRSSKPLSDERRARTGARILAAALACVTLVDDARTQVEEIELSEVTELSGYLDLVARLGANAPTGADVVVAMAEPGPTLGAQTSNYGPDASVPELGGKSFALLSGPTSVTAHATLAAQHLCGQTTSVAPGTSDIRCYNVGGLLGAGFLNGANLATPAQAPWKVLKLSGGSLFGSEANQYMRKLDRSTSDQGLFVVCSVRPHAANGTAPHDAPLFSHSFNSLAVGTSEGRHQSGPTLSGYDGPGRQKPDIVAPSPKPAYAHPLVAGGGSLLIETARSHPALSANPNAQRPEVLKAVLMAGAEHSSAWANNAPTSGASRGLATRPLDDVLGAGELDANDSHWILTGTEWDGATSPSAAIDTRHNGWDLSTVSAGEARYWRFQVEAPKPHVSVVATWSRYVEPDLSSFELADLSLELYRVGQPGALTPLVGTAGSSVFASGNVCSQSTLDNVEHLFIRHLQPGEYMLALTRPLDGLRDFDVAVAWEFHGAEPILYGTPKTTSAGTLPTMSCRGVPSSAENDFEISVSQALANKKGVFFYGLNGASSQPFKGGLKLVQGPLVRLPAVTTDANGEVTLPIEITPSMLGQRRNYQFWFRDPGSPSPYGLSDAIEITFCP